MATPRAGRTGFSITRLRTFILVALVAGVAAFTGIMLKLVDSVSARVGPQVEADLEWRALHGAQELAERADLGLAGHDPTLVAEAFVAYAGSSDVKAIVALDLDGKVIAHHGSAASADPVFADAPANLVRGPGYVASWAPAVIDGKLVGKVAVVVSTARRDDAQAVLARVSNITLIAGVVGALLGAIMVLFFTRHVAIRDHQLNDYADNLADKVEARTRELDARNRGMRLVLDNVAQGFITVDLDGVMASERSAIVDRWFGAPAPGMTFDAYLDPHAPELAVWFTLGLDSARSGALPIDLCFDETMRRFSSGASTFDIKYSPIMNGDTAERVLVIISDVTEQVIRERAERDRREMVTMFQRITADRSGFDEFLDDTAGLVTSLVAPGDPLVERRTIHTLKGNCGIYGLESYAELCHDLETELADSTAPLSDAQRAIVADGWRGVTARLARLLGETRRDLVEIELVDLARAVDRVKQGMTSREIIALLTSWSHEPVARRFERLARYAGSLSRRLGKGELDVAITDDGIRLDTPRWAGFWSALVHAVRNAIDHGIEPPEVRAATGKPARPKLAFVASRGWGRLVISVSDDGGGVRWDAVRERARQAGLPAETPADLEQALFADGFSTAPAATETSGRGVGMAALRDAVVALGGAIELETNPQGTTLRFRFADVDDQSLVVRQPTLRSFKALQPDARAR